MIFVYILFAVYIFAINFYAFCLLKSQRADWESGEKINKNDGKLFLAAILGGATAIYASMFIMRYRLNNLVLMIVMPLVAVVNLYLFFLGFRGIYFMSII